MIIGKTRTNQPVEKEEGFDTEVQELMEQGEPMTGYSVIKGIDSQDEFNPIFIGACKNGNKITFVVFGEFTKLENTASEPTLCDFVVPTEVFNKLYPSDYDGILRLDCKQLSAFSTRLDYVNCVGEVVKRAYGHRIAFDLATSNLLVDQKYLIRFECTFLLSDNLIPQE